MKHQMVSHVSELLVMEILKDKRHRATAVKLSHSRFQRKVKSLVSLALFLASCPVLSCARYHYSSQKRRKSYNIWSGTSSYDPMFASDNDENEERVLAALGKLTASGYTQESDEVWSDEYYDSDFETSKRTIPRYSQLSQRQHSSPPASMTRTRTRQLLAQRAGEEKNRLQQRNVEKRDPERQSMQNATGTPKSVDDPSRQERFRNFEGENVSRISRQTRLEPSGVPIPHQSMSIPSRPESSSSMPSPVLPMTMSPWVRRFLGSCHKDVLLPVPKDYILDNFNLAQLAPIVEQIAMSSLPPSHVQKLDQMQNSTISTKSFPYYRQALRLLVQDDPLPAKIPLALQRATTALYVLIHQRYVLSPRGLDMVRRRFLLHRQVHNREIPKADAIFGKCPRQSCRGMPLLPIGDSKNYQSHVTNTNIHNCAKRYCAACGEVFYHWDSVVDGSAWGPSFCHLFLLTCGQEVFAGHIMATLKSQPNVRKEQEKTVPDIFGFQLHPSTTLL